MTNNKLMVQLLAERYRVERMYDRAVNRAIAFLAIAVVLWILSWFSHLVAFSILSLLSSCMAIYMCYRGGIPRKKLNAVRIRLWVLREVIAKEQELYEN